MLSNLDAIIESIRKAGRRVDFYGGATTRSIETVESALKLRFPPSYRSFLTKYGGGGPEGDMPIAGIYDNQPLLEGAGSVYGETVDARREFSIPSTCAVIFRDDDTGVLWCIDSSMRFEDHESPVVSIDLQSGSIDQKIAPNFGDFVVEHFRLRI